LVRVPHCSRICSLCVEEFSLAVKWSFSIGAPAVEPEIDTTGDHASLSPAARDVLSSIQDTSNFASTESNIGNRAIVGGEGGSSGLNRGSVESTVDVLNNGLYYDGEGLLGVESGNVQRSS